MWSTQQALHPGDGWDGWSMKRQKGAMIPFPTIFDCKKIGCNTTDLFGCASLSESDS